jgi:DNA-binding MarR family transcriptional regulator
MYDDALRPVKIRITQYSTLSYLAALGETRVRDLGTDLLLEETTLTRSLRPLEAQGWVQSRPGDDRRERYVSITPEGRQLLVHARQLWSSVQDRLRERVSTTTWEGLFRTLPKLAGAALAR